MRKRGVIYIVLLVLAILLLVIVDNSKPKEINWFPSYNAKKTLPFGTYILAQQLENVLPNKNIHVSSIAPHNKLSNNEIEEGSYFFINSDVAFGPDELESLLDWVSEGNNLIVASHTIEESLLDTLQVSAQKLPLFKSITSSGVQLKNDYRKEKNLSATYDRAIETLYFDSIKKATPIAHLSINDKPEKYTFAITKKFGAGSIVLITLPEVFTNYFILKENNNYFSASLLEFLKGPNIYLDQHYINGKVIYLSPLYLFLENKYLKLAYYFLMLTLFIFIIFEAKRTQRPIPIIKPLTNQTLAFTRTIGNMYYQQGMYKDIVTQKIELFLTDIRLKLHIPTEHLNDAFYNQLSARTNKPETDIRELFDYIKELNAKNTITKNEVLKLNSLLEEYNL
ncbi:DUF4350 domain-containing protein [Neptunitalea lumnitzerae]|uniref:DUF4350 domain-containing protein n=1 Tax=Neptunitalea lumnitzerae TaxID=2965509 RepID=A0ABQ5MLH4_9FLAO|nr:DUF4350 domain-containing protein [Neptunitalea sp. Y10]GLB50265.1 hypothetical protein Y10_26330 [Neptunitalea sp. Y10]